MTLISLFVGSILDWHKMRTGKNYVGADDPGVLSVTTIYNYYKKFGSKTQVMGASFRNIEEIKELAGCDLLTIAPKLLEELDSTDGFLPRKLEPTSVQNLDIQRIGMDRSIFAKMHSEDQMATEKLEEGIAGFTKALENLERLLRSHDAGKFKEDQIEGGLSRDKS